MMADYYRIHSIDHPVALCRELYSFKQRGWMCDVVIEVEDGEMRAHKIVLSASSPFFRNFLSQVPFSSEMTKVVLKGVYMEELVKIIEYMYAGTFDVNTAAIEATLQICKLLRLKFVVEKLKEISKDCTDTYLSKGTQKLSTISKALNDNQLIPTNIYSRKPIIAQLKIPGELENGQHCTSSNAVNNTSIATVQPVSICVTTQPRKSPSLKNIIALQTNGNSTSMQKDTNRTATNFLKSVDNDFCNEIGLLTLATTADMSRIGNITPTAGPSGNYGNQVCFTATASVFQPYSTSKMKSLNSQCRTHKKTATINVRTFMKSFQNIVSGSYKNNQDSIKVEGMKNKFIIEDDRQTVPVLDTRRRNTKRISEASTQTPYNSECMEYFHENGSQQNLQVSVCPEKHSINNLSDACAENARKSLDDKISETEENYNFKNVAQPLAVQKIKDVKVKQEGQCLEDPNDDNAPEVVSDDDDNFEENYALSNQSPVVECASSSKKRKTARPRKLSEDEHKNVGRIGTFRKDSSMRRDTVGNFRLDRSRRQQSLTRRKMMDLKKNLNKCEKKVEPEPVMSPRRSLRLTIKHCELDKNSNDAGLHKNQSCIQYPVKVEHGSSENMERRSSSPSSNVSSVVSSIDSGKSLSRSNMDFSPEAKKTCNIDKEQYFADGGMIEIAAKDNFGDRKVNLNGTDAGVPSKSYIILKKKSEKRSKPSSKQAENGQKKIKSEESLSKLHSKVSKRSVNEELKREEDSDVFAKEDGGNSSQGYKCRVCSTVFRVKVYRASHEHTKHGLPYDPNECEVFKCDFEKCEYETVDKHRFVKHKQFSHSDERPHICEDCGKQFKSLTNLRSHQLTHIHAEDANTQHTCPHCDHKFKREQYLKEHIKNVHNKERKELCHLCSRGFAKRLDYHKHMFKVHLVPMPDKYKIYHCDECDFTAFSSYHVTVHKASHKESRDHQCPNCSKTFKSVNAVKRHMTYHDTPSFACEHENCNYAAFSKSTLMSHIKLKHTQKGMKPFECQFCSYRCVIKGNMVKHIRLVHDLDVVTKYTLKDKEKYKDMQSGTLITKTGKCFDPNVDRVPRKKCESYKSVISVGSNSQMSHGNRRPVMSQMESQTVSRQIMKAASVFEQLNMEQLENIGFQMPTDTAINIQEPFPSGSQNSTGLQMIPSQDPQYHTVNQSTIQAETLLDENAIAAEDLIVSQEETIQTTSNSPHKRVIVIKSNPGDSFLETADLIQAAIGQGDETSRSLGILTALLAAGQQAAN